MSQITVLSCCREENGELMFLVPLDADLLGPWTVMMLLGETVVLGDKKGRGRLYTTLDNVRDYFQENLNLAKDSKAKWEYREVLNNLKIPEQRAREEAERQNLEPGECFDMKVRK